MLTIFGNIKINDQFRLRHFKDSFKSFNKISDEWIINIRGERRKEAMQFLKKSLGSKLVLFDLTDDSRGWSVNALEMIKKVSNEYVFIWNEDHINLASQNNYKHIMQELKKEDVDSMWYSWWLFGKSRKGYNKLPLKRLKYVDTVLLTKERWQKINKPGYPFYIISFMSIFRKSFFEKLLKLDSHMFPYEYTQKLYKLFDFFDSIGIEVARDGLFFKLNKFFSFKFRKFSEVTPFNLEREQYRTDILPIKIALSKKELFACIEDDLEEPGYSLVSRGLYKSKASVKNKG